MTVIVASNRVARAKSDEPVAGGLATALIPMVKDSGAIWVGSSGQTADAAHTKDSLARIEALGHTFDPHIHQAVETVQGEQWRDQEIVEELLPGFTFRQQLLRPSMVKVAVAKRQNDPN